MTPMLTQAERDRFATYLEQEAKSDEILLIQMRKILAPAPAVQKVNVEMMAAKVIAMKLRSIEGE